MKCIEDVIIKEYLCSTFAKDVDPGELSNDDDLFANGLVSSLELLVFISWVGDKFNISIEETIFGQENFRTIGNVISFINKNTK